MSKVFLLGASDPEMQEIENLLWMEEQAVLYAAVNSKRCHGGNAHKADGVTAWMANTRRATCSFGKLTGWDMSKHSVELCLPKSSLWMEQRIEQRIETGHGGVDVMGYGRIASKR